MSAASVSELKCLEIRSKYFSFIVCFSCSFVASKDSKLNLSIIALGTVKTWDSMLFGMDSWNFNSSSIFLSSFWIGVLLVDIIPPIPPGGGDSFLKKIFRKYYPPPPIQTN